MNKPNFLKVSGIAFLFCVMTAIASSAQTFKTHSFNGTDGSIPNAALVQGTDGNFYGTTGSGGSCSSSVLGCGTVFKMTAAGKVTTLHSFNGTDGVDPDGALVQGTDGNFYGTTEVGGLISNCAGNGCGTVFKITAAGALTTLYSFCPQATCTDGDYPQGALVQGTDGNFYGTTSRGGSSACVDGCGTVFKITPAGTLTTLYSFCALANCSDGASPQAGLVQGTDGEFYGTTEQGGTAGSVFKITAAGALTTLHKFTAKQSAGGYDPRAGLIQGADGNFYGTTWLGGANDGGTVFQITPAGTLITLYSFCALTNCADGEDPYAGVVQGTDGNFYGTTHNGGYADNACQGFDCGTVFQLTPAGVLTTLHTFDWTDGGLSNAGLLQGTNGTFYGTSTTGGALSLCYQGCGTIFSVSTGLGPFVKTFTNAGKVGAKVVILGNNLTSATSVAFNGTAAPLIKVTASAIETSVPTGATTGSVTVTTPSGTLDSNVDFQVLL
jgi:uncharacterized repeat protein (TIGR03803 family)